MRIILNLDPKIYLMLINICICSVKIAYLKDYSQKIIEVDYSDKESILLINYMTMMLLSIILNLNSILQKWKLR